MSIEDMDRRPRLRPENLNTDACVALAATVLRDAATAYVQARRALRRDPLDPDALAHYRECRRFYQSDYFKALSMGLVEPEVVMASLEDEALNPRKPTRKYTNIIKGGIGT